MSVIDWRPELTYSWSRPSRRPLNNVYGTREQSAPRPDWTATNDAGHCGCREYRRKPPPCRSRWLSCSAMAGNNSCVKHCLLPQQQQQQQQLQHRQQQQHHQPLSQKLSLCLTKWLHIVLLLLVCPVCSVSARQTQVYFDIQEELDANTLIGDIVQAAHLDNKYGRSTLDNLRFTFITKPDFNKTYFAIEEDSGLLYTTDKIDRDFICPGKLECLAVFDVAVKPVQYFQIIKVTVEIADINDNRPTFPERTETFDISESTLVGTSFALPAAHDPDSGINKIQGYELRASTRKFELSKKETADGATDLRLVLRGKLDREAESRYTLRVIARDAGNPPKSSTLQVLINVLDANDHNPVFEQKKYEVSVLENKPIGSTIVQVRANDPDAGLNGDVSYQFEKHTEQEFGKFFELDSETGYITVKGVLDYESNIIFLLSVSAHDEGPDSLPSHTTVIVRVEDTNDNAPEMSINTLNVLGDAGVMENSKPGTFVAYISVVDADSGDNGKVVCTLNDNVNFALEKRYLTEFKVVTARTFNREIRPKYEFIITCKDHGSPQQTTFATIEVDVQDENDHAPHFTSRRYSAIIDESNMVGAMLMKVNALDEDIGPNGEITYQLAPGGQEIFTLDSKTGVVKAAVRYDYEYASVLETQVIASDGGSPPRSATATIRVTVLDIDDERPEFQQASFNFGVYENLGAGASVGYVVAKDADAPPNDKFHYYLEPEHTRMDTFSIDPDTGLVSTKRRLDREIQSQYFLTVAAVPVDWPLQGSSAHVTVYVLDKNDNPPVFEFPVLGNNTVYVPSNAPLRYVITRLRAKDKDSGKNGNLKYSIVSGNRDNIFTVDSSTGAISIRTKITSHQGHTFRLKVKAQDRCEETCDPLVAISDLIVKVKKESIFPKASAHSVLAQENLTIILGFALAAIILIILVVIIIIVILRRRNRDNQNRCPDKEKQQMLKKGRGQNGKNSNQQSRYVSTEEMQRLRSPKKEPKAPPDGSISADSTLSRNQNQFTDLPPPPSSWIQPEGQTTFPRPHNGGHAPNGGVLGNSWQDLNTSTEGSLPVHAGRAAAAAAAATGVTPGSDDITENGSVGSVSNSDSGRGHSSEDGDRYSQGDDPNSVTPPRGPGYKHWNLKKQKPRVPVRRHDPNGLPAPPAPSPVTLRPAGYPLPPLPPPSPTYPPPVQAMQHNNSITNSRQTAGVMARPQTQSHGTAPSTGIKSNLKPRGPSTQSRLLDKLGCSDHRVRFAPSPVHSDCRDSLATESNYNSDTESADSGEYVVYDTVDDTSV